MSTEKEQIQSILEKLPEEYTLILREILQEEKNLLHRKNLQGSNIVNTIVDIIKERVTE